MRKNIILGFLLAFVAANISAQNPNQMPKKAQAINLSERWGNYERSQYFGVRFGMNVSQVMFYGPDVDNSSRVGFNGGLVAGFMLSKSTPIFIETGLLYQGKGAYVNNDRDDRVTIRQHFLEIPAVFKYKIQTGVDHLKVQPFVGMFMAFGVSGETRFYGADPARYRSGQPRALQARHLQRRRTASFRCRAEDGLRTVRAQLLSGTGLQHRPDECRTQLIHRLRLSTTSTTAFTPDASPPPSDSTFNASRTSCI